jgi:hypothetical protein
VSGAVAGPDVAAAFKADSRPRHQGDVKARLLPGEMLHAQFHLAESTKDFVITMSVGLASMALTIGSWIGFAVIFGDSLVTGLLVALIFTAELAVWLVALTVGSWLVVTDQRLVYCTTGMFRQTQIEVPLESVRAVAFASNKKTKTFGIGSLLIDTGDDHPPMRVPYFPVNSLNPEAVPIWPASRRSDPAQAAARGLSGIVVALAGLIAPRSRAEWIAEQASAERLLPAAARLRFDCGLVKAAVIMRLSRMSAPLVARVDAVACSEKRTRKAACLIVGATAVYVFFHEGLAGLISNAEGLAVIGAGVYGLARWRRQILKSRDQ